MREMWEPGVIAPGYGVLQCEASLTYEQVFV
jgi:hypothetical protein